MLPPAGCVLLAMVEGGKVEQARLQALQEGQISLKLSSHEPYRNGFRVWGLDASVNQRSVCASQESDSAFIQSAVEMMVMVVLCPLRT